MSRDPDLNDRNVAKFGDRINYLPRANYNALLELVGFEDYEDEESGKRGYGFKFIVRECEAVGKQSKWADDLPEINGDAYSLSYTITGFPKKLSFIPEANKRGLRKILAALWGEPKHTADFDANKALRILKKHLENDTLEAFIKKLPLLDFKRRGELSDWKDDEESGEQVRYFNVKADRDVFTPVFDD